MTLESSSTVTLTSMDFSGVIAAVQSENVIGVQFHPERSGKSGIDFLSNVAKWALS
jgi:imidazoleglycerol phosphate synthase glutamine amidotransferase subunit HisH